MSMFRMLSAEQVAPMLGCQPSTVEAAWRNGKLPGVRIGQSWQVPESALHQGLHMMALGNLQKIEAAPVPAAAPALPAPVLVPVPKPRGRARRDPPALPQLPPVLQVLQKAG